MTKPRKERYLTLSNIHDFVRSVQLVARPDHARNVIYPFGIHDFVHSVQLVARPNHAKNVIQPFRIFTISCVACNLLHDQITQGTLFILSAFTISCVACILMHDQATQGTLFNPFGIHDFVQQVARYDSFIFRAFDGACFTACTDNRLI